MIKRSIEDIIKGQLFGGRALIIMGARQVGKTTLLKQLFDGNDYGILWMSGDDPDVNGLFENITSSRLRAIIGNNRVVIIDEEKGCGNGKAGGRSFRGEVLCCL